MHLVNTLEEREYKWKAPELKVTSSEGKTKKPFLLGNSRKNICCAQHVEWQDQSPQSLTFRSLEALGGGRRLGSKA